MFPAASLAHPWGFVSVVKIPLMVLLGVMFPLPERGKVNSVASPWLHTTIFDGVGVAVGVAVVVGVAVGVAVGVPVGGAAVGVAVAVAVAVGVLVVIEVLAAAEIAGSEEPPPPHPLSAKTPAST